jgi:hypothetical protein
MKIIWLIVVLLSACGIVSAQDITATLDDAHAQHEQVVKDACSSLERAFLEAIKSAAAEEHLSELRALLDARDQFVADGSLPDIPSISSSTEKYLSARKASAKNVYDAYRRAIADLNERLLLNESSAVTAKMKAFVNAERVSIGLEPTFAANENDEGNPGDDSAARRRALSIAFERLSAALKRMSQLPTTAQRAKEHKEILDRLDAEFKRTVWEVRFPISNVKSTRRDGYYSLTLGMPFELADIALRTQRHNKDQREPLSWVGFNSKMPYEKMPRAKALQITDKSYFLATGRGRIAVTHGRDSLDNDEFPQDTMKVFVVSRRDDDGSRNYCFILEDCHTRIVVNDGDDSE